MSIPHLRVGVVDETRFMHDGFQVFIEDPLTGFRIQASGMALVSEIAALALTRDWHGCIVQATGAMPVYAHGRP